VLICVWVTAFITSVVGGEYEDRPFYINYTLEHRVRDQQEIGQHDFAGLRSATSVLAPDDSEKLHFIPFRVKIGVHRTIGANINKEYLFDDEAQHAV
jgi:hypothetical protein